jgi:hypothetical protein
VNPAMLLRFTDRLAGLVRSEIETTVTQRLPVVRRSLGELVLLGIGLVCLLVTLGGLSWGAVALISERAPAWAAAVVVAGCRLLVSLAVLRRLQRCLPADGRHLGVLRIPGPERQALLRQRAHNDRARAGRELSETLAEVLAAVARAAAAQGTQAMGAAVEGGVEETIAATKDGVQDVTGRAAGQLVQGGGRAIAGATRMAGAPGRLAIGLALRALAKGDPRH